MTIDVIATHFIRRRVRKTPEGKRAPCRWFPIGFSEPSLLSRVVFGRGRYSHHLSELAMIQVRAHHTRHSPQIPSAVFGPLSRLLYVKHIPRLIEKATFGRFSWPSMFSAAQKNLTDLDNRFRRFRSRCPRRCGDSCGGTYAARHGLAPTPQLPPPCAPHLQPPTTQPPSHPTTPKHPTTINRHNTQPPPDQPKSSTDRSAEPNPLSVLHQGPFMRVMTNLITIP
eukprot:COSAG04_NODE_670_length_11367_cov_62.932109_2_plen_225_part_00